eukprot:CAMPEP_0118970736 /NCGR_PEP_ID=MMETSP1173-20130426/7563_1 /TAXON_ID=1034831 /ORGANISM="Rhizochromulina marina cf, Strain CCMP1243" /LENGTH=46 /DNA_ID= /DNA_START= /DNA_END= /DNA_ORIENTATION=
MTSATCAEGQGWGAETLELGRAEAQGKVAGGPQRSSIPARVCGNNE